MACCEVPASGQQHVSTTRSGGERQLTRLVESSLASCPCAVAGAMWVVTMEGSGRARPISSTTSMSDFLLPWGEAAAELPRLRLPPRRPRQIWKP